MQAALGHAELQVGRLRHQAGVALDEPLLEQGPGSQAAAPLLVRHQVEHHVAGRRPARPAPAPTGRRWRRRCRLSCRRCPGRTAARSRPGARRESRVQAAAVTGTTSRCPLMIRVGRSPGPRGWGSVATSDSRPGAGSTSVQAGCQRSRAARTTPSMGRSLPGGLRVSTATSAAVSSTTSSTSTWVRTPASLRRDLRRPGADLASRSAASARSPRIEPGRNCRSPHGHASRRVPPPYWTAMPPGEASVAPPARGRRDPRELLAAAQAGDKAALGRLLSLVERGGEPAREVGRLTFAPSCRRASTSSASPARPAPGSPPSRPG